MPAVTAARTSTPAASSRCIQRHASHAQAAPLAMRSAFHGLYGSVKAFASGPCQGSRPRAVATAQLSASSAPAAAYSGGTAVPVRAAGGGAGVRRNATPRPTSSSRSNSSTKVRPLHGARSSTGSAASAIASRRTGRCQTSAAQTARPATSSPGRSGKASAPQAPSAIAAAASSRTGSAGGAVGAGWRPCAGGAAGRSATAGAEAGGGVPPGACAVAAAAPGGAATRVANDSRRTVLHAEAIATSTAVGSAWPLRQEQPAGFDGQRGRAAPGRGDACRPAVGPDEHADRRVGEQHPRQTRHRLRLGGVVVVVEGQQFEPGPGARRGVEAAPGLRRQAAQRRQRRRPGDGQRPGEAAQPCRDALRPQRERTAPEHPAGGHAEGAGEHRRALAGARGDEELRALDRRAEQQADQHHPRRQARPAAARRRLARRQPAAQRQRRQPLGAEAGEGEQRPPGRAGDQPAPQVGRRLLRDLVGRQQQVVGKERHRQVGEGVGAEQQLGRAAAALEDRPAQRAEPVGVGGGEGDAEGGADGLGEQVVEGDAARREPELREFDRHRQQQREGERDRRPGPARDSASGARRCAGERLQREHADRHVEHAVGDPVGARFEPQHEERHAGEGLHGGVERQLDRLQGDEAAVDHEADVAEPGGEGVAAAGHGFAGIRPGCAVPAQKGPAPERRASVRRARAPPGVRGRRPGRCGTSRR